MPEISVLLCVYNGEAYLTGCIDSILGQTFTDFEFVIVNDGSTDRSPHILTAYAEIDSRIILIDQPNNLGIAASVTEGIKHCHGKYIARMDQDDISTPDRLLIQHHFLETHPEIDVVGSSLAFIDENGDLTGKTLLRPTDPMVIRLQMYYRCVLHNPSVLMRKEYYMKYNQDLKEADYQAADDYSLWLRENTRSLYANLEEPCLLYRVHTKQTSSEKRRIQMDETLRSTQLAYRELLGRTIPTEVIESFYYIRHTRITDSSIALQGFKAIYHIQKAIEKKNHLTSVQRRETRRFSYEKLKSYLVKYRDLPGILPKGALLLLRLSPGKVVEDIVFKILRKQGQDSAVMNEE